MSKKSFKNNPATAFISHTQEVQDTQEVHEVHEVHDTQEVQEVHDTQGKRGQKKPRINMAFSEENLYYLRRISRYEGESITQYVNRLIDQDRKQRQHVIEALQDHLK